MEPRKNLRPLRRFVLQKGDNPGEGRLVSAENPVHELSYAVIIHLSKPVYDAFPSSFEPFIRFSARESSLE
jgi:hypothetical protein